MTTASVRAAFDAGCGPVIPLTIRRGPNANRTYVYCTCGWARTYKTRQTAARWSADHLRLANA